MQKARNTHSEYYMNGTSKVKAREQHIYFKVHTVAGKKIGMHSITMVTYEAAPSRKEQA